MNAEVSASAAPGAGEQAKLKYAHEIKQVCDCPPASSQSVDCYAYRFAFDKLDKSFTPVALFNPQMTVSGRPVAHCCEGYSLSMFDTLEQLRKRARAGLDRAPNFLKRIGDHFVRIKLTALDGIRTPSSSNGHFEFFEAATFDGPSRSLAHARLFP
jgi:hypothetical protein